MSGPKPKTFEQRCEEFWKRVDRGAGGAGSCWIWTGPRNDKGYGVYRYAKRINAHRFAWASKHGWSSLRTGIVIRHKCDNPPCCNPAHLEPGTTSDNSRDMVSRGRQRENRGQHNGNQRLTSEQAVEIRNACLRGESPYRVAPRFGVSRTAVRKIMTGETWRHAR